MGSDQPELGGPAASTALVEAAEQRDWLALPTGVLRHIFRLASTWRNPGPCLAAPVCSEWRSAAAGCRHICLLYQGGYIRADQSFAAWLEHNSQRLEALTFDAASSSNSELILTALAEAAAAAQATGSPLPLRTLRVLEWEPSGEDGFEDVDLGTAGKLLACLPHLRCLRLGIRTLPPAPHSDSVSKGLSEAAMAAAGDAAVREHLGPLQRATQLEELYLRQDGPGHARVAELLPLSLKRLSWDPNYWPEAVEADLSHLTQLTFLEAFRWDWVDFNSSLLPPGLQQLEVLAPEGVAMVEVVEQQRQVVTAWDIRPLEEVQQLLPRLPNLKTAWVVGTDVMCEPSARAALQASTHLSDLAFVMLSASSLEAAGLSEGVAAAASMRSLRCLELRYEELLLPPALGALTQLTQLRVFKRCASGSDEEQKHKAWAEVVGSMVGLQRLSVPSVLLTPGQAWLAGLQQLRVLMLDAEGAPGCGMSWLEGCTRAVLPQLQVLGVSGVTAWQEASWQVWRRLQRLLGSSGCEVVVGWDMEWLAAPCQQLTGVPAALQHALG